MAIATSLQLDDEPQPVEGAATSLVLDGDAPLQSQGSVATSLERDDSASRLDDLTFVPGDTDQAYEQWKEWLETQEKQSFGMDDAIEIGKTMFGELYDGGKAFAANLAEGEFRRIVNSIGEGVLRGTADIGILANKGVDRLTRDEALTRERFRGWREIRKLEAMREKARLGEEDIIDHLAFSEDPDAFFGYNQTGDVDVDPALAEGASYVTDIGTVVGGAASTLVRKGVGKQLARMEGKALRGVGKASAKGMQKTGDALKATGSAIKDKVVEITPDWALEIAERHGDKLTYFGLGAAPKTTAVIKGGVEAADRIGPAGSVLEKSIDELPEFPTNMGPLERTSKNMNVSKPVRYGAGLASRFGGDAALGLTKDLGRSAAYGSVAGAALGGFAEGTEGAKSGAFAAGLTGGLGGLGGRAIDTITGQRDAVRMQGSINDFVSRHQGDQEAMAMLVDMSNLEVVDKASGNLRNMARRALEDLATASEVLRGRVEIKVLPDGEFAKVTNGRGVDGFYNPQTKEIVLNADSKKLSDTLLHEVGEAMWDSGVVDRETVRNQVESEYDLIKIKRSYAEQMLKAEKRGKPTDDEITQRVRELDRQFLNDGDQDWVVREMFAENFMSVSTDQGLHNYVRNNSRLSKLKVAVQRAAAPFGETPITGLGMAINEAKGTVFSVVDVVKGGLGLDGLGYKKEPKQQQQPQQTKKPENVFGIDLKSDSELSKSYKKYARELNRQYEAFAQGKEETTNVKKDSSDDRVNWDGVGKEYFDDVPDTAPSKGKDEGPQDSDSGAKGGGKKRTRKRAKNKQEIQKRIRQRRKEVRQSLDEEVTDATLPEVTLKQKYNPDGTPNPNKQEYRGKFLQSKYSDAEMMENFKGSIDEINQAIADGRPIRSFYLGIGTRSQGDSWVNSVTRKRGDIPATVVNYIPHEWFITNKGNVNVRVIDLNYVRGRVASWRDTSKLLPWNNDVDAFLEDARKYLENHRNNIPGKTGLTPDQHNIINALFQANNKDINPLYSAWDKNSGNRIYKNLRIERIASLRDTSANGTPFGMGPFDHLKAKQMFSPTRAPEAPQRELDNLGMFSKAQEAIEGMQQKKGTSQQFLKAMDKAGVKKEELEDIGLDVFLKDNPTTTKEDVLNFIKANQIEMVEVTEVSPKSGYTITDSQGGNMFDDTVYPTYAEAEIALKQQFDLMMRDEDKYQILPASDLSPETIESYEVKEGGFVITKVDEPEELVLPYAPGYNDFTTGQDARNALVHMLSREFNSRFAISHEADPDGSATKFSEYTEPGAEIGTYTERLLTLRDPMERYEMRYDELNWVRNRTPKQEEEFQALEIKILGPKKDPRFGPYTSSHFDEENIIAHVRHNDRIGPDGEKILFLEEIQSDWHQEGRSRGYQPEDYRRVRREFDELYQTFPSIAYDKWADKFSRFEAFLEEFRKTQPKNKTEEDFIAGALPEYEATYQKMLQEGKDLTAKINRMRKLKEALNTMSSTPNAPFKKSWPEFSMKRMLKLAADEGYDAIAWTTGETQNARYNLGDKVSGLDVIEYDDGTYELMARLPDEDVFKTVQTGITKDKLPEYIGKELTKRALDNMEGEAGMRSALLEGDDLRLGGKGMRGFYDEMLPKLKLWKQTKDSKGKPLQVQQKTLRDGLQANYVALNEDINSKVSAQGVPRYSVKRGDLWQSPKSQEYTSAETSINRDKTPATFGRVKWERGTVNADIGGGRFDNATDFLARRGVKNYIFDPFNRSRQHNDRVANTIADGGADTATVNNVLNVIKEPGNRHKVIAQAADAIKLDGEAYFLIYEGNRSGKGGPTKAGYQNNLSAKSYVKEISRYFGNVTQRGNLLVATKPKKADADNLPGFNVKSEPDMPFADLILSGRKTIETRAKPTLNSLVGRRVKLIETTGKGSGKVKGEVTVGEPKFYKTKAEFDADFDKHFVQDSSEFAFSEAGKWGYPMEDPVIYQEPYETNTVLDKPKGRVLTSNVPGRRFSPSRTDDQGRPLGSQKSNDPGAVELDITSYDKDGKPVYQTVDYSILDSPFFQQWEGGPRGAVQDYDLDNVHYDVTQKAKKRIKELIDNGAIEGLSNLFVEEYNRLIQYPGVTDGMGWYSRMREAIKQVFGKGAEMFTHLLGATSAKTPVENNFIYAAELMKRYQKGDFNRHIKSYNEMYGLLKDKKLYETMVRRKIISRSEAAKMTPAAMTKRWIEHYNLTPVRANGKQYGQNSLPALKAMAKKWLVDKVTPKTPQFAMNLGGSSLEATIDVWAARLMRRLTHEPYSEKWRIQPKSEGAVNNQDFAVSQVVFREAARKLGMNPDDLQAIVWFGEKHVWDENGWTGNIGAFKSSFDEAFDVYFPAGRPARQLSHAENIISFLQKERLIKKHLAQGETDKLKGDIREYDKARKLTGVQAYIKQTGRRDVVKSIPPDVAADAGIGGRQGGRNNRGGVPNDRGGATTKFSPARQLNNRGGAIYLDGYGFRAVQTSSRAGVRVYSDKGRRVGPVFNSVEKAQDHLDKLRSN
jgi:hypothetical protein